MGNLRRAVALATGMSLALCFGAGPSLAASGDGPSDIAAAINKVAPQATEARIGVTRGPSAFTAGAGLEIPGDASGQLVISADRSSRKMSLSFAGLASGSGALATDGTVVYRSGRHSSVGVQAFVGGVRVAAVLQSPDAGNSMSYALDLPKGAHLQSRDDGALSIVAADGSLLGGIASPWARDAQGHSVDTSYAVVGSKLVQTVEPTPATAYPIVADPFMFIDLIDHATWYFHSGYGFTFQVSPTTWGRLNSGGYAIGAFAWDELYTKYRYRGLNTNLNGMRDQLICHWQFAFWKDTYNLDEWRPDVGYPQTVNSSCNPGGPVWFD